MREYKLSTKRGRQIYDMGNRCCWSNLRNLYDKWSDAKEEAFNRCWEMYINDKNSTAFGIGNANSFGFTASWLAEKDGENILRVETKDNSYLVWLDR